MKPDILQVPRKLKKAWVPVVGDNFIYIYCLWVLGKFKGKAYARSLLTSCIKETRKQGKSGVCILSSKKKKPYLSDKVYMIKYDFETVDRIGDEYELLALSFDGTKPNFTKSAKRQTIDSRDLSIYYGMQCPYIPNCIIQI